MCIRDSAEGIGLAPDGTVSEGAGENIFIVKDGALLTPGLAHSVLGGLTRDAVMKLAHDLGIEVRESSVPRLSLIHISFAEETETDLFGEQAVLCGGATELVVKGYEDVYKRQTCARAPARRQPRPCPSS